MTEPIKLNMESNISRILQIRIPKVSDVGYVDETYTSATESYLSRMDTTDKIIIDNLMDDSTRKVNSEVLIRDAGAENSIIGTSTAIRIKEPIPTSEKTLYNFANIIHDDGKNVFLIDYTQGNNRIHIQHSSGSYSTFMDDGSYIFKATPRGINDITHTTIVKGDIKLLTSRSNIQKIGEHLVIDVDSDYSIKSASLSQIVGGNSNIGVGGDSFEDVGATKEIKASAFNVNTKDGLLFQGKTFAVTGGEHFVLASGNTGSIVTGLLNVSVTSSYLENTMGKRTITAEGIDISAGTGPIQIGGGGNVTINASGLLYEKIDNGVIQAADLTVAKKTDITLGGYELNITTGNIAMDVATLGNLSMNTLLGSTSIGSTVGLGALDISIAGETKISNLLGSVKINEAGLIAIKSPATSLKAELDLILDELNILCTNIAALTVIYALGTTSVPVNAPAFIQNQLNFTAAKARLLTLFEP